MPTSSTHTDFNNWSDLEIAEQIAGGDHFAFELMMRRHNRPLYRTARSILKDDAEAEDALQDAYLAAYRNIKKFRGESALATWLTRIVINEAIARARKGKRRAQVIQIDGDALFETVASEESMNQTLPEAPETAALRTEARRMLERQIDALPDAYRTVFVLRALEEMSVEETAHCLDIPAATVRSRFFRARGILREALAREIDFVYEEAFSFDGTRCDRIVAGTLQKIKNLQADEA
ncbi:RNA polymerase sigma factor [Herminiimonas sp. KBW02]|uniref:RNA polymerase sigma factor n=1 Tax=Herminiimonas sp. KBW02 TaxID=2153363 RepID=UPI000F5AB9CE|nr:RNA polymerase sigma factor [Herminiimonas sp. KBW02]RQO38436.1 RNA polymerase sigma factor [Herminiimonas sp. KBW02]